MLSALIMPVTSSTVWIVGFLQHTANLRFVARILRIVGSICVSNLTSSRGSAVKSRAMNRRLSQARAASVLAYLNGKYPAIDGTRFTVKGYGKDKPLVPNTSDESRAKNRRVEFTVLNKEVLKKEIERRRLLKQGEAAPADSTVTPR